MLEYQCNISKPYYQANNKFFLRPLNGDEKMKMFDGLCLKELNLANTFKDELAVRDINRVHKLWSDFITIYTTIKRSKFELPERNEQAEKIRIECANWLILFCSVHHDDQVIKLVPE